jgi:hypothetical protein
MRKVFTFSRFHFVLFMEPILIAVPKGPKSLIFAVTFIPWPLFLEMHLTYLNAVLCALGIARTRPKHILRKVDSS